MASNTQRILNEMEYKINNDYYDQTKIASLTNLLNTLNDQYKQINDNKTNIKNMIKSCISKADDVLAWIEIYTYISLDLYIESQFVNNTIEFRADNIYLYADLIKDIIRELMEPYFNYTLECDTNSFYIEYENK